MRTLITILLISFVGRTIAGRILDSRDSELRGDDLAEEFARRIKNNSEITGLDIPSLGIKYKGALAIANALNTSFLTYLNLAGNWGIGARGVAVILNASKNSLIDDLNLDFTFDGEWEDLYLPALLENSTMSSLSLGNNWLSNGNVADIGKVLDRTRIASLNLECNQFGAEGVSAILAACENHPMEHLGLTQVAHGKWWNISIADLLNNTRITSLNLSRNEIQYDTAVQIIEATKHTNITSLDLSSNPILVMNMTGALNHSTITNLSLASCLLETKGAYALANVLPNTCLVHLNIANHRIQDEGIEALAEALPNTLITQLILDWTLLAEPQPLRDIVSKRLRENQLRINGLYEEFKELVGVKDGNLEFAEGIDRQRCANFTGIISRKGRGYIRHFSGYEDGRFTKDQIEEFILNIEKKLG